jgi:6-pyruvoyltetrahydropterin/6-carboxytetrahydropterin synthase
VSFSSGHRYWQDELSPEQNQALFGGWASPYNHGHNYVLDVETRGPIDPATGMVVNIKDIDAVLQDRVVLPFNQKSLNDEVSEFSHRAPSIENLLDVIRARLTDLPRGVDLVGLTLHETDRLSGNWTPTAMTLTRTYEFAASHRLHVQELSQEENVALFGKCNNAMGHGHNYSLEVTVGGIPDQQSGMLCDLTLLDSVVEREIIDRYDHKNLNFDIAELAGQNPTSEVVGLAIFDRLQKAIPDQLVKIKLHETARNAFEVRADERGNS